MDNRRHKKKKEAKNYIAGVRFNFNFFFFLKFFTRYDTVTTMSGAITIINNVYVKFYIYSIVTLKKFT